MRKDKARERTARYCAREETRQGQAHDARQKGGLSNILGGGGFSLVLKYGWGHIQMMEKVPSISPLSLFHPLTTLNPFQNHWVLPLLHTEAVSYLGSSEGLLSLWVPRCDDNSHRVLHASIRTTVNL